MNFIMRCYRQFEHLCFQKNTDLLAGISISPWLGYMEKIPAWIERKLLRKLNEITGEIKTVEAKIESVDNKVDVCIDAVQKGIASLRSETLSKFEAANAKLEAMDARVASLRNEMISRFYSFEAMIFRFGVKLNLLLKLKK